jgi:hypothetical protein
MTIGHRAPMDSLSGSCGEPDAFLHELVKKEDLVSARAELSCQWLLKLERGFRLIMSS